jgi:uncharacterized protein
MNCLGGRSTDGPRPILEREWSNWRITTVDEKGNDALTGGMMKRMMPEQQGITNYINVKSVREYAAKVEQLGGKVFFPIIPVPGMGYFAMCADTEDNAFAIWETDNAAK